MKNKLSLIEAGSYIYFKDDYNYQNGIEKNYKYFFRKGSKWKILHTTSSDINFVEYLLIKNVVDGYEHYLSVELLDKIISESEWRDKQINNLID